MRLKLQLENLHIATGILVIGSQRVNKQSEDLRCDNADIFQLNLSRIRRKIGK